MFGAASLLRALPHVGADTYNLRPAHRPVFARP